jgi:hypothetical protein
MRLQTTLGPLAVIAWIVGILACSDSTAASVAMRGGEQPLVVKNFQTDSVGLYIREIAIGNDIWTASRGESSVAQYARDGRLAWHGVTRGEGPDQALIVWGIVAAGDTAFAWDPVTRRLLRIVAGRVTPEATFDFVSTRTVSGMPHAVVYGHVGRFRRWTGGWVTYATDSAQWTPLALSRMVVLRFTPEGRVIDTLADLRAHGLRELMEQRGSGARDLLPVPLWDICQERQFVLFDPATQTLSWRDVLSGDRDSLELAFTPTEIPESFMRAHLLWQLQVASMGRLPESRLKADVEQGFPGERHIFGDRTFYATSMFCDAVGRVWIQRFSLDAPPKGFSPRWEVFDLRTRSRVAVVMPEGFQAKAADSSLVYGVVEDEDGVQSVATLPRAAVLQQ